MKKTVDRSELLVYNELTKLKNQQEFDMKTIAEQLEESHIDDFGKYTVPFSELQKAGGVIIDSSNWAPYYTVKNWNRWEFPDRSTYFQYFEQRIS